MAKKSKNRKKVGKAAKTKRGAAKARAGKPKTAKAAKQATRAQPDGKPKRMGALDAAVVVLRKAGRPMHCRAMIAAMAEQGVWSSPKGKTPHATLYAAVLREIGKKGTAARFKKIDRGQFAFNG